MDLIDSLRQTMRTELRWVHTAERPGDVRHTLADISQAKRCLSYRPRVSFEEGIVMTVEYFTSQMDAFPREHAGGDIYEADRL